MKWKDKKLPILIGINIILLLINIILISDVSFGIDPFIETMEVIPEENNNQNTQTEVKKKIALTFDDGPHEKYTPMLLDGLKERNVSASFFNGKKCRKLSGNCETY